MVHKDHSLILLSSFNLDQIAPGAQRIFSEMVSEVLSVAQLRAMRGTGAAMAWPQVEIPSDRIPVFTEAAKAMIDAGIDTPEDMARMLDETFNKCARRYSEAVWDMFGMVRKDLRGTHDWNQIYATIDTSAGRPTEGHSENVAPAQHPTSQDDTETLGGTKDIVSEHTSGTEPPVRFTAHSEAESQSSLRTAQAAQVVAGHAAASSKPISNEEQQRAIFYEMSEKVIEAGISTPDALFEFLVTGWGTEAALRYVSAMWSLLEAVNIQLPEFDG